MLVPSNSKCANVSSKMVYILSLNIYSLYSAVNEIWIYEICKYCTVSCVFCHVSPSSPIDAKQGLRRHAWPVKTLYPQFEQGSGHLGGCLRSLSCLNTALQPSFRREEIMLYVSM